MTTLFRAGWQLTKVRGLMYLSLACAAGCLWAGIILAQTYGLNPGDGGELAPLPERLAWGVGVSMLGIGFAAVMWLYGWCYVATINLDKQTQNLHIDTVRFFGSAKHVFNVLDMLGSRYHVGRFDGVNAPWQSVKMAGRRLPFIIDKQGLFLEKGLMNKLF